MIFDMPDIFCEHGCFNDVLKKFQASFKVVSGNFYGAVKGVSNVLPGCFNGVSREFWEVFSWLFLINFYGYLLIKCFKEV